METLSHRQVLWEEKPANVIQLIRYKKEPVAAVEVERDSQGTGSPVPGENTTYVTERTVARHQGEGGTCEDAHQERGGETPCRATHPLGTMSPCCHLRFPAPAKPRDS